MAYSFNVTVIPPGSLGFLVIWPTGQTRPKAIWSLAERERNRVHLSLRWFRDAMFDLGVNAFLKYWFALETISMPSTTDIGPLNDILCSVYGLPSRKEANNTFQTGIVLVQREMENWRSPLASIPPSSAGSW